MNNLLQFIWWVIFLGPVFKVITMVGYLFSINADKKMKLSSQIRNWILGAIGILSLIIGAELSIHGLTLIAYILIMVAVFFIIFIISDFFKKKFLYILLVIFPVSAFLGYWTGVLAVEVGSFPSLELVIITIPFILPYLQYKLIFSKEKLIEYIDEYQEYIKNQSFQNKEIIRFTKYIEEYSKLHEEYLSSLEKLKNLEKKLYLTVSKKPKKTSIFKNKGYYSIKNRISLVEKWSSFFTESLSFLTGGSLIGGSDEESIVKAIGHFNDYLSNSNKKHFQKIAYMEITKSKCDLINKINMNYYLMFYLKYLSNSEDYLDYFSQLKKCTYRYKVAWNERNRYTPLTDAQKRSIKTFVDKINTIEEKMK